jgi:hypothetical protein
MRKNLLCQLRIIQRERPKNQAPGFELANHSVALRSDFIAPPAAQCAFSFPKARRKIEKKCPSQSKFA